jgi:hypothetical protein
VPLTLCSFLLAAHAAHLDIGADPGDLQRTGRRHLHVQIRSVGKMKAARAHHDADADGVALALDVQALGRAAEIAADLHFGLVPAHTAHRARPVVDLHRAVRIRGQGLIDGLAGERAGAL